VPAGELTIEAEPLRALRAHAAEGHPHEVVGVLAGHGDRVTEIAALINERADSPRNRYQVSGLVLMRAEQGLEAKGLSILGYYHSHPDHPARYSDFDRDHALPNLSYVIVSVEQGVPGEIRSWRLREDRTAMDEQSLHLESP